MTVALASRTLAVGVTHPHSTLGVALLLLALLAAVGAIALVASRRPAQLAAGLSALTVVLGVSGVVALASTRDCPASGCGTSRLTEAAATPTASPTPSPTASPTPSPTAAPTASPTPSPTASPTPSRTPSPTPSATPSRTAAPTPSPRRSATPSPTPAPAFTATVTQQPTCDDKGAVTRPAVVTLRNTTSAIVTWSAAADEKLASGAAWAGVAPSGGSTATGGRDTVTITPDASLCTPGDPDTTDHVTVTYGSRTLRVAVTVTPRT